MRKFLFLNSAQRFSDFALLIQRLFVGLMLVSGVWGIVTRSELMREQAAYLAKQGFFAPELLAPVLAYLTLCVGIAFVVGLVTRWAGILCVLLMSLGFALINPHYGKTALLNAGLVLVIGLHLATYGAGRFSVDALLRANDLPRPGGGVRFKV